MGVEGKVKPGLEAEWALAQLGSFKARFDPVLKRFLDDKSQEASEIRPELAKLIELCAKFVVEGGKRLRPAFMYYGFKLVADEGDTDDVLKAAIPFELVHAGALVHDDIMDNSDLRRGKPTVHRVFEKDFGSADVGRALAIVAGDMILALADNAVTAYSDFGGRYKQARPYFDLMCREINYGQHLDVVGNLMGVVDEDWIMKVMRYKTAGYTVEKPLMVGATLGGATTETVASISKYGIKLGIAFQIKDDILGMFGDEAKVGKPVDSDLKEGKKTLLVSTTLRRLMDAGRQSEVSKLKSILGNPKLTGEDYVWCQELMRDTGVVDYCQLKVEELTYQARQALEDTRFDNEATRYLLGISDFLVAREY